MGYHISATKPGFFHSSLGNLPDDAVPITDEQHTDLQANYAKNKVLKFGAGYPEVVDPPPPSSELLAAWKLSRDLTVKSKSNPELDGLYKIDLATREHIDTELQLLGLTGAFSDGEDFIVWQDAGGGFHPFTAAEFKTFAIAVHRYAAALHRVRTGSATAFPSETVEID